MNNRNGMGFPSGEGFPYYYPHTEASPSPSGSQSTTAPHAPPPGFRPVLNPTFQQRAFSNFANHSFPFQNLLRNQDYSRGYQIGMAPTPTIQPQSQPQQQERPSTPRAARVVQQEVPRKRGRPKKYDDEVGCEVRRVSTNSGSKPGRGRPRGTGKMQRLANLGQLVNVSAGTALEANVIDVEAGEDIVAKVVLVSQEMQRALCVLSAKGTVSSVRISQPTSTTPLSFQGRFEILNLRGCYRVDDSDPKGRTGSLGVCLCGPDGRHIGGKVEMLIADSPIQVSVWRFGYGKEKEKANKKRNAINENGNENNMINPTTETPQSPPPPPPQAQAEVPPVTDSTETQNGSAENIDLTSG